MFQKLVGVVSGESRIPMNRIVVHLGYIKETLLGNVQILRRLRHGGRARVLPMWRIQKFRGHRRGLNEVFQDLSKLCKKDPGA